MCDAGKNVPTFFMFTAYYSDDDSDSSLGGYNGDYDSEGNTKYIS